MWGHVALNRGACPNPCPGTVLEACGFLRPPQKTMLLVIAWINWSIEPCRTSMQSTGGSADTWVPAPVVMEEGTAPRCRCVMHRGGLAAPGIASALPSPPLPLPWDPLQPSSSCSSHWHLLPSPGVAPSFGTPQAHCQCLLHLLSVSILCYTPTALPAEPTLGKEWAQFPNVLATFLVPFFSPCLFSCPDPPSPVPHF